MRKILKEQILIITDFIFGALILFMSISTAYFFKAVTILCRRPPTEETNIEI